MGASPPGPGQGCDKDQHGREHQQHQLDDIGQDHAAEPAEQGVDQHDAGARQYGRLIVQAQISAEKVPDAHHLGSGREGHENQDHHREHFGNALGIAGGHHLALGQVTHPADGFGAHDHQKSGDQHRRAVIPESAQAVGIGQIRGGKGRPGAPPGGDEGDGQGPERQAASRKKVVQHVLVGFVFGYGKKQDCKIHQQPDQRSDL